MVRVEALLDQAGYSWERHDELGFVEFPLAAVTALASDAPHLPLAVSTCIVEIREGTPTLRELQQDLTTPATLEPTEA